MLRLVELEFGGEYIVLAVVLETVMLMMMMMSMIVDDNVGFSSCVMPCA